MHSTWRAQRLPAAAAVLLLVSFLLTWQVAAADRANADDDAGRMVLVLDSSGSMKDRASGGQTKIAAAKEALDRVVGSLPDEQAVGLRVYGAEVFSRDDAGACQDSQLVVPVETGNRSALREALRTYRPYGETPIGFALQKAAEDLGDEGKRTVVLVSDGEPTCDPDPCEVARDLSKKGVDLKVDVVGLDVDGSARKKLQCIAAAGHGTYYDVASADQLAASLEKLATRAARPYAEIGEAVSGTSSPEGAPEITEGDWLDEIGGDTPTRHYLVRRTLEGSTLHVSAAFRNPGGAAFNRIELTTPDGQSCGSSADVNQLQPGQLTSAAATVGPYTGSFGADYDNPCVAAPALVASVSYEGETAVPLEVRVLEEGKVADVEALPAPAEEISWVAPGRSAPRDVVGGSSFADAPVIEPGSYRDNLVAGEVLTYQVEVGYGQQLSALVDFPELDGRLRDAVSGGLITQVDAFTPARAAVAPPRAGDGPFAKTFLSSDGEDIGFTTAPVGFSNATETDPIGSTTVPGMYTVTVFLEEDTGGEDYLVPFRLDVDVTGEEQPGPEFVEEPLQPEATSTTEPSPRDDSTGGGGGDPRASAPAPDDEDSPLGLVVGGLGVLALLSGAYLAVAARRRGAS